MDYHHYDEIFRSTQGHPLYLGDIQAAEDIEWLMSNNVRTGTILTMIVITAASGFNLKYDASIKHITYFLEDKKSENASAYFDMGSLQIDKRIIFGYVDLRTNGVLVHCGAGVSRVHLFNIYSQQLW